jgi:glycosyltransferase involved in cell wall biosynthesis
MNVAPVLDEVRRHHPEAETIAVDDCGSDGTSLALAAQTGIGVLRLPRHLGQGAAIYRGLTHATGERSAF